METTEFSKIIDHFKTELSAVRSGRANPALVERIEADVYGNKMKLIELASISVSDARTLIIDAWDKNALKDIEKAITLSGTGLGTANDGKVIRVTIPQLTEESRKELLKIIGAKLEQAKVSIRKLRDKMREEIQTQEKKKEMGEDERFRKFEEIDKYTKKNTDELESIAKKKEDELKI